jgi:hypothetical protein
LTHPQDEVRPPAPAASDLDLAGHDRPPGVRWLALAGRPLYVSDADDLQVGNVASLATKGNRDNGLRPQADPVCIGFAQNAPNRLLSVPAPGGSIDPDLAGILEAWPTLPDHIKAAVVALVGTVR